MAKTRKPLEPTIWTMLARTKERSLGQGVEGQCPKCHHWQVLPLSVKADGPLGDGEEFRIREDATLWPWFVCLHGWCMFEGLVRLVQDPDGR